MTVLGRIATILARVLERRRLHWVEISLAKAWSRDMPPRLFDLDGL